MLKVKKVSEIGEDIMYIYICELGELEEDFVETSSLNEKVLKEVLEESVEKSLGLREEYSKGYEREKEKIRESIESYYKREKLTNLVKRKREYVLESVRYQLTATIKEMKRG